VIDLAHVANGGLVVAYSDQHFGRASNLLLPGRGIDMGDGWETRRSRGFDHCDWAIIKLGTEGIIEQVVVDTAHFKGNFAQSIRLEATQSEEVWPSRNVNISWCHRRIGLKSYPRKSAGHIGNTSTQLNS
jgi:allantoicase